MIDPENPPEKVKKWIKRLKKCFKEAPTGLWFFSNGELHILADGKDGQMFTSHGGVDPKYRIDSVDSQLFEGGDW